MESGRIHKTIPHRRLMNFLSCMSGIRRSVLRKVRPAVRVKRWKCRKCCNFCTGKNLAARNDSYNWNNVLNEALEDHSDVSFLVSAGDQVNYGSNEREYAGYLGAEALTSLPVATTIGNHDSVSNQYSLHFNNPNAFPIPIPIMYRERQRQEPITIIVMEMSCSLFLIQTTITVQRMRMS